LLERAQAAGLSDGTLHAALAQLRLTNGELYEANLSAKLALQDSQLTPAVRMNAEGCRARVFFQRKNYRAAQQILEQLVSCRHLAIDWALLGSCRKETGDLPGALTAVERAAQMNPGNIELAWVLMEYSRLMNDAGRHHHFRQRAQLLDPSLPVPGFHDATPAP
jgi:tetratricopeptide (TPR) repeat protein